MFGLKSKSKKQPKSLKKKLTVWLVVFFVIIGATLFALSLLNKPAVGTIKLVSRDNKPATVEVIANKLLKGDYFTLQYPGRYEFQSGDNKSASLDSWILIAHQALGIGQASKIGVSIDNLNADGIEENSAFRHASAFMELYDISSRIYADDEVKILERTSPSYELTALWPHNGRILTISLTSAAKTDELAAEFEAILLSVVWHE